MLVQDIGYQRASEQTGIAQPTLRQWAKRGGWNGRSVPHSQAVTTVTRSPADSQAEEIAKNGTATKLGLSEYAKKQAKHLATKGKLRDHNAFRNLASGSATLHGWNQEKNASTILNLGILIGSERPARTIEAHVIEPEGQDSQE